MPPPRLALDTLPLAQEPVAERLAQVSCKKLLQSGTSWHVAGSVGGGGGGGGSGGGGGRGGGGGGGLLDLNHANILGVV